MNNLETEVKLKNVSLALFNKGSIENYHIAVHFYRQGK